MKEDKPKKPKKRAVRKPKSEKPVRERSSEQDELERLLRLAKPGQPAAIMIADSEPLDPVIKEMISHALKNYSVDTSKTRKMRDEEMKTLEAVVSEFLKSFIIIGYDLSGEKIQMMHAVTPQDYDSLIECARGSLLTLMIKAQQQLPGLPPNID